MENPDDFSQKVINAVETKTQWYNDSVMPKFLEEYRIIHTCVKNLYDLLLKKSFIKADPYRLEKKISSITPPDNSEYSESDRVTVIGVRFSDYETMLDWICTYYTFSIEHLTIPEIKKFLDFNNSFQWNNLTENNTSPNSHGLALLINDIKRGSDALTTSSVLDIVSKCQKSIANLSAMFKDLSEFQKEVYKCRIRKDIFQHPKFEKDKAMASAEEEMAQIKKSFPPVFGKEPFYTQLVEEVIKEDHAPNKEQLQENLLKKLVVSAQPQKKKKAKTVDTKEMLMTAVQSLCSFSTPIETVHRKLLDNNQCLQDGTNSGFAKFLAALRKAFNIPERPISYELQIVDVKTSTSRRQKIDFFPFCNDLQKKVGYYNAFALRSAPGYKKLLAAEPAKVLEFLDKNITEVQNISVILKAFDTYFKNSISPSLRPKIKGLSMELTSLKNNIINTNQYRADYVAYIEEQEQLKKLGITEE